jgi:SAM-dependent methyltransferase
MREFSEGMGFRVRGRTLFLVGMQAAIVAAFGCSSKSGVVGRWNRRGDLAITDRRKSRGFPVNRANCTINADQAQLTAAVILRMRILPTSKPLDSRLQEQGCVHIPSKVDCVNQSEALLLDESARLCRDPRFRDLILRHCPFLETTCLDGPTVIDRFSTRIHPGDQMLNHSLREHRHAGAALSQYFNIALQQYSAAQQVIRSCFGASDDTVTVLDFACGYGRLLRFLSLAIPGSRLWACELQADALAFVEQEFAVQTIASHADPACFEPGRRFDFIWVASLFSHLPEHLFHSWLERLTSLLTDRGVLCFSVRDSALLPTDRTMPRSGILYDTESENAALGSDIYGTTWANEHFVRDALHRAAGGPRPCVRLPKALAQEQDLYVVAKDPGRDLSGLDGFRRGPWGWVDRRTLTSSGRLDLQGWAASLDDGAIDHVDITVNDVHHHCPTGALRNDVRDVFNDDRMMHSGWEFQCEIGSDSREVYVEVSAPTPRGESSLLLCGPIRADSV